MQKIFNESGTFATKPNKTKTRRLAKWVARKCKWLALTAIATSFPLAASQGIIRQYFTPTGHIIEKIVWLGAGSLPIITLTQTFNTSGSFATSGFTVSQIECVGAGGGGGGATFGTGVAGGGGADSIKNTPGSDNGPTWTIQVGTGEPGDTGSGATTFGGLSQVLNSSTTLCSANGGLGGDNASLPGNGGDITFGPPVGDVKHAGGNGGSGGFAGSGGGGGGSATSSANGGTGGNGDASPGNGGTGGTGQGAGGTGGNPSGNGSNGNAPGAGGGAGNTSTGNGGNGANGRIIITYTTASFTNWTETVNDSEGITDSRSASRGIKRAVNDPEGITDSRTSARGLGRTVSDPEGITDSMSRVTNTHRTISDPEGITDSTTWKGVYLRSISDSEGITDFSVSGYAKTINDFEEISDTAIPNYPHHYISTINDPMGITDSMTALYPHHYAITINDTEGVFDYGQPSGSFVVSPVSTLFDEIQFPVNISFGSQGGPEFDPVILETHTGAEVRVVKWNNPLHKYDVSYAIKTYNDLAAAASFFIARQGSTRGFRYKDWSDYSSAADGLDDITYLDQPTIPLASNVFQLVKVYNDGLGYTKSRTILKPVSGTVIVAVSGTPVLSGWTVDTTAGILTFGSAPAATPTAGFQFDVPCRFGDAADKLLSTSLDNFGSGSITSIPIYEIKAGAQLSVGLEAPILLPILPDVGSNTGGLGTATYRQLRSCTTGALVNLWILSSTLPSTFPATNLVVFNTATGGCYSVLASDPASLTPGIILTTWRLTNKGLGLGGSGSSGCNSPDCQVFVQYRRCTDSVLVNMWALASTAPGYISVSGVLYYKSTVTSTSPGALLGTYTGSTLAACNPFVPPPIPGGGGLVPACTANGTCISSSAPSSVSIDLGPLNAWISTHCCWGKGGGTGPYTTPVAVYAIDNPSNPFYDGGADRCSGLWEGYSDAGGAYLDVILGTNTGTPGSGDILYNITINYVNGGSTVNLWNGCLNTILGAYFSAGGPAGSVASLTAS